MVKGRTANVISKRMRSPKHWTKFMRGDTCTVGEAQPVRIKYRWGKLRSSCMAVPGILASYYAGANNHLLQACAVIWTGYWLGIVTGDVVRRFLEDRRIDRKDFC